MDYLSQIEREKRKYAMAQMMMQQQSQGYGPMAALNQVLSKGLGAWNAKKSGNRLDELSTAYELEQKEQRARAMDRLASEMNVPAEGIDWSQYSPQDVQLMTAMLPKTPKRITEKRSLPDGKVQDVESYDGGQTWQPIGEPYSRRSSQIIQGVDGQGNPANVVYDPGTNQTRVVGGKPKKPPSEGERQSSGYYQRMKNGNEIVTQLESTGFNPASLEEQAKGLTNATATPEMQQYRNAADDWIRAKLRKESGAVIGPEEMAKEYEIYFPRLGDSPQVVQQKARLRKQAEESMRTNAGTLAPEDEPPETPTNIIDFNDLPDA